jgi:pimeloyl-ACP methyl ester carboxylesterase
MTSNGEVLFGVEFGALETYRPTDEELAANAVPVHVLLGVESAPFFGEAARWLAPRLDREVVPAPGAHVPMMSHPDEFVELLRSLI